ncbi:alpha/beta hydrolase [Phenylobacterium sp.]|uniref:alpha/beta hydrolase n=1 Tax=Phenylobacterium sp. TaxID=1871053 RepID=UPI002F3FAF2E
MPEPAPLIATPEAPVPPGGQAHWFAGADGARLRAALFAPVGPARGSVVLSGGRTEPIEKYFEVVGELLARGFVVLAHDWRGQGLSQRYLPDRLRGHADGHQTFLSDFHALLAAFGDRLPEPWIALGHSMGGCLTLLAVAQGEAPRFAAAVLSAPMLGLKLPMPPGVAGGLARLFRAIGRGSGYTLRQQGRPFDDTFEGNLLTHDERRFRRYRRQVEACPELALGGVTWGWLDFAFRAMAEFARAERLRAITLPVLMLIAEADRIIDTEAQRAVATRLPDVRVVVVPDARHEILMETDDRRAVVWAAFDALAARVAP